MNCLIMSISMIIKETFETILLNNIIEYTKMSFL